MALNASDHGETLMSFGAAIFLTSFTSLQAIIGAAANLAVFITILCTRTATPKVRGSPHCKFGCGGFLIPNYLRSMARLCAEPKEVPNQS